MKPLSHWTKKPPTSINVWLLCLLILFHCTIGADFDRASDAKDIERVTTISDLSVTQPCKLPSWCYWACAPPNRDGEMSHYLATSVIHSGKNYLPCTECCWLKLFKTSLLPSRCSWMKFMECCFLVLPVFLVMMKNKKQTDKLVSWQCERSLSPFLVGLPCLKKSV